MHKVVIFLLLVGVPLFACAPDPCALGEVCSATSYTPPWWTPPKPLPTVLTIAEKEDNFWLPAFTLGDVGFCEYFHAAGGRPPYDWRLVKDVSFSDVWIASDGSVHGLPGASGNYDLTIVVTDSLGATDRASFHVQVCAPGEECSGFGN